MNNSYYDVKTVPQLVHTPFLQSFLLGGSILYSYYWRCVGKTPMIIQKYFFSCLNGNQFTTNQFYLHCVLSWDCVIVEHFCIVAVLQNVLCNPLPLGSITSLCCHTCHYSVQNNQINLQPLIRIIIFSCPRSLSVRIYNMKSALTGGVVRVSL